MTEQLPVIQIETSPDIIETHVGEVMVMDGSVMECFFCHHSEFDYMFNEVLIYENTTVGPNAEISVTARFDESNRKKTIRLYRCRQCGTIYSLKSRSHLRSEFVIESSARNASATVGRLLLGG